MLFESFIGPAYESASPIADCEDLINLYREKLESRGSSSKYALYPTPGFTKLTSAVSGPGRAHFFMNGREFMVIGAKFYELDSTGGVLTDRGNVALDANPATISSNGDGGNQLFITSGGNGYIFNTSTNVFASVPAISGLVTMGDHLDGYFLALSASSSTVYFSALNDGTSWTTGTDFFARSAMPDPWVSLKVLPSRNILVLGETTSEVWYDAGNASSPFVLHPSGVISYGIVAPFSVAMAGKDAIWLGTSRVGGVQVMKMSGFTPEPISTYPLQTTIGKYATKSDAVADTYQENGHTFYLLSFPTQDITWGWDDQTSEWHKRGTWMPNSNKYGANRARWHADAFGEHRMLDSNTGDIYRMASTIHTDVDGVSGLRRLRRAPALVSQNKRIKITRLELGVEVGLGLTSGQGSDPQMIMRLSQNGAKTFGAEQMRGLGKIGNYATRVVWNRLGSARRPVIEVVVTDPIPVRIMEAYIETGAAEGASKKGRGGRAA
jgi:hypothetical protein